MRVSWRNLDWVGEADRGEIEKKLAGIGGAGSPLLDRIEFVARNPSQAGAPFEVRITGNVAKNQITAVRREATAQAAFQAALGAFEGSAMSVWSARNAAPTRPPVPAAALPALRRQPAAPQSAALVSRWRPDLSLPRLNLSLDRQALFERLAQPTRGAWRAASSLLPQPTVLLRRALSRQNQRSLDRDRAEALERMGWRERLATLAMWNEVEAAERWAREQVFARRYRSELDRVQEGDPRLEVTSSGWRERIADFALWTELEAAERWAREQVMARLRRGPRELEHVDARGLLARGASRRAGAGWRARLADLSLWDTLEGLERRMRDRTHARPASDPLSSGASRFAQVSRSLGAAAGLVRRGGEMLAHLVRAPIPVRAVALSVAFVVGLWSFQGVSNTVAIANPGLEAAYSAVAIPESWAGVEIPFSAVAVPLGWEAGGTPFSAIARPFGTQLADVGAGSGADASAQDAGNDAAAYSAIADRAMSLAQSTPLTDGAALRD